MDFSKIRNFFIRNKLPIFLFVIAFLLRIVFVYLYQIRIWDETVYANLGYDLSLNPFHYSFDGNWSDYVPSIDTNYAWPHAGFRAPLLPYVLAIFYFLKVGFLIDFFIPFVGALTVVLVYYLGKMLFNGRIAFYSALFFSIIPIHVIYSGRLMTDVFALFFIVLSIFSFWKGYELNNDKYKLLFGLFLALAILSRYTSLWIIPLFPVYLLFRDKSLKFLKDKYLWCSVLLFFLILLPWFFYSQITYGNPLGAFIHGSLASTYWGGLQPWNFFFQNSWQMFSILGIVFIFSLVFIIYKKEFLRKEVFLILIWMILIFGLAMIMPHKEDRLILSAVPALCILAGFFFGNLNNLKFRNILLAVLVLITLFSLFNSFNLNFNSGHNINSQCYGETMHYLSSLNYTYDTLSENSAIAYYYTRQQATFYPYPLNKDNLFQVVASKSVPVLIVFNRLNSGMNESQLSDFKEVLNSNYLPLFNCSLDAEHNFVYSFNYGHKNL